MTHGKGMSIQRLVHYVIRKRYQRRAEICMVSLLGITSNAGVGYMKTKQAVGFARNVR